MPGEDATSSGNLFEDSPWNGLLSNTECKRAGPRLSTYLCAATFAIFGLEKSNRLVDQLPIFWLGNDTF
jgi:hypothetical protein